jgi:membrane-associated phospholipid phosphatase
MPSLLMRVQVIVVLMILSAALMLLVAGPIARRNPGHARLARRLRVAEIAVLINAVAWLICMTTAVMLMSYLLIGLAPPLVDAQLAAADSWLGLDWPAIHAWVRSHHEVSSWLGEVYHTGFQQLAVILLLTVFVAQASYLREFLSHQLVALILILLVSGPFPAAGAFQYYAGAGFPITDPELAPYSHFFPLRNGTMPVIDLDAMQGLVSMPSFHAAGALLYAYAMRWSRLALLVAVPLNLMVVVSAATEGGHYFVDLLAGIAVFALTVLLVRRFSRAPAPARSMALAPQTT